MKIYVAGSSAETERAQKFTTALQQMGIQTTNTWIEEVVLHGGGNPDSASPGDRRRWAQQDLKGVDDADGVWILLPTQYSHGAFFEIGYALAKGKTIYSSGQCTPPSIFLSLTIQFETDLEAFCAIVKEFHSARRQPMDKASQEENQERGNGKKGRTPTPFWLRSSRETTPGLGD